MWVRIYRERSRPNVRSLSCGMSLSLHSAILLQTNIAASSVDQRPPVTSVSPNQLILIPSLFYGGGISCRPVYSDTTKLTKFCFSFCDPPRLVCCNSWCTESQLSEYISGEWCPLFMFELRICARRSRCKARWPNWKIALPEALDNVVTMQGCAPRFASLGK